VFGRAILVAIAEELAPGLNHERASFARADGLGVRLHHINRKRVEFCVFVLCVKHGADGVCVVIDRFDIGDFGGELRVDGELGAGESRQHKE